MASLGSLGLRFEPEWMSVPFGARFRFDELDAALYIAVQAVVAGDLLSSEDEDLLMHPF